MSCDYGTFRPPETHSSNAQAQLSSGARCLIFGQTLRLLPYWMYVNSEGSGETLQMRRLTWAFAGHLRDKHHNLMSWLNWLNWLKNCPVECIFFSAIGRDIWGPWCSAPYNSSVCTCPTYKKKNSKPTTCTGNSSPQSYEPYHEKTCLQVMRPDDIENTWVFQCKIEFYFTEWTP